jgi:hypothetical protein
MLSITHTITHLNLPLLIPCLYLYPLSVHQAPEP